MKTLTVNNTARLEGRYPERKINIFKSLHLQMPRLQHHRSKLKDYFAAYSISRFQSGHPQWHDK
jgi:hypothetical protein